MLSCFALEQLSDAIAVIPALEILVLEQLPISEAFCDLIAPPTRDNSHSPPQRLPNLNTLYIPECPLKNSDNLRGICSASSIHNLIITEALPPPGGTIPTIQDVKRWVGPEINVSIVPKDWEMEFPPFSTY